VNAFFFKLIPHAFIQSNHRLLDGAIENLERKRNQSCNGNCINDMPSALKPVVFCNFLRAVQEEYRMGAGTSNTSLLVKKNLNICSLKAREINQYLFYFIHTVFLGTQ
jgi:hypothetical protein